MISEETRQKMRIRATGRVFSKEARENMRLSQLGRKCSVNTKMKMSLAHRGEKTNLWRGGVSINTQGYRCIYSPNHPNADCKKYVREHRLVIEKKIGRYLTKREEVHHINGDKLDNRVENLFLFPNKSEHMKYHYAQNLFIGFFINLIFSDPRID